MGLDTSGPVISLGLATEKEIVAERQFDPEGRSVGRLSPEIARMLSDCGLEAADLDGFAVGAGPGSFTGLKVGFAAVFGLAFAKEQPIWTCPTLKHIAWGLAESEVFESAVREAGKEGVRFRPDSAGMHIGFTHGSGVRRKEAPPDKILVLTEAKKGYFYRGVYRKSPEGVGEIEPVLAVKIEELDWPEQPLWVTGSALVNFRKEIISHKGPADRLVPNEKWHPAAGFMARLAATGRLGKPAGKGEVLEPIFLKSFETKFKEINR